MIFHSSLTQEYLKGCESRIHEVVGLVRGKLDQGTRLTMGALIVTYVHGKYSTRVSVKEK